MGKKHNKVKRWLKSISLWDITLAPLKFISWIFHHIYEVSKHIPKYIYTGIKWSFPFIWVGLIRTICFIPTGIGWIFLIMKQLALFLAASIMIPFTILAWIVSFCKGDEQPIEVGIVDEL